MTGEVIFDPLLPWPVIWGFAALSAGLVALALWRGLAGWAWRGLAAAVLVAALAQPALQREEREPLTDIVILVVDETASQRLAGRAEQTTEAAARIAAEVAALPNTELRQVTLADAGEDAGTLLLGALSAALAEEPRARIAGAILVSPADETPTPPVDAQPEDLDVAVADIPDAGFRRARPCRRAGNRPWRQTGLRRPFRRHQRGTLDREMAAQVLAGATVLGAPCRAQGAIHGLLQTQLRQRRTRDTVTER